LFFIFVIVLSVSLSFIIYYLHSQTEDKLYFYIYDIIKKKLKVLTHKLGSSILIID